jgi:hypothetical protein
MSGPVKEPPQRRLSDRISSAFDLACEQKDLEVAELLHQAFEMVMTRQTGADKAEKRTSTGAIEQAYDRLVELRRTFWR